MYRNQSKILPGLSKDILDWVVETRRKSAMLLHTVILNAESNVTQHTQLILECLYKAAVDEDRNVVEYVSSQLFQVNEPNMCSPRFYKTLMVTCMSSMLHRFR